ncbi:MAG TPA: carbohydrate kinase family protein [Candidatus Saccharimonadia bacterium]|nr:carbohydrate kinase family protein [Candidatus Saccharimonadia bacterium]
MNFSGKYRELIQPEKLHVLSISTLLDKLEDSRGGSGANIAYGLAQLGEKPVLLGSVGSDAQFYIDNLGEDGVDVSHIHFSNLATASFNVITDSEDNQVGGFYQGAMSDSDSLSFVPWKGQNALMLVGAHQPAAMNRQVKECVDNQLRLVYDPGQQVANDETDLKAGVAAAEILMVNDYEQGLLCRRLNTTPEQIKAQVPIMVTTFGKEGSAIEGTKVGEPITVGIAVPNEVTDPTGAGDAYRAGFLYGYLRQWDLKKCGQLGATLASFVVEKHGTQQPFSKAVVRDRFKANFGEEVELNG